MRMLLIMAINLYTSRIVLIKLGVEDYGIYNLVAGVVVTFTFFQSAMNSATSRFLSFALGKNDTVRANRIFCLSLNVYFAIIIMLLVLAETVGLWFLNYYLNISESRLCAANWVYQFSILSFCMNILVLPYNSCVVAYERMSFYVYLSIVEAVLKLMIVVVLSYFIVDRLILYGALTLIVSVLIMLTYHSYCKYMFKICQYRYIKDTILLKEILGFSGWSLLENIADILVTSGITFLLNIFIGVFMNAVAAIANQVNGALFSLVQNFQTAFRPQIVKSYSAGENSFFYSLIYKSSKFSFFLFFFFALPVLLNTNFIFSIWLKEVPEYVVEVTQVILLFRLVASLSGSLWMSIEAAGVIKKYQIISSFILLLNLPLCYIALKLHYNPIWIFVIRGAIVVVSHVARVIYAHVYISVSIRRYFKEVIGSIVGVIVLSSILPVFVAHHTEGWERLWLTTILSVFTISIAIFFVGIDKWDRANVKKIIYNKLSWKRI